MSVEELRSALEPISDEEWEAATQRAKDVWGSESETVRLLLVKDIRLSEEMKKSMERYSESSQKLMESFTKLMWHNEGLW